VQERLPDQRVEIARAEHRPPFARRPGADGGLRFGRGRRAGLERRAVGGRRRRLRPLEIGADGAAREERREKERKGALHRSV
jgi:hypothetical protein